MPEERLESWLRQRKPPPPRSFAPHLLEDGYAAPSDFPGLTPSSLGAELSTRGMGALSKALAHPGRAREAAFRLLAADAFLTYACEAMVEEENAKEGLEALLEGLGRGFR